MLKSMWVQALDKYLELLTKPEHEEIHTIKISYNSVRPEGERLKTFGGKLQIAEASLVQ